MKKPLKITLILLGILFVIYHLLSWTGIFTVYSNPTTSNLPNLELNSRMVASNLTEPKNGDFVCYKNQNGRLGNHIRVHRLCGMENDIIEIKNGTLFINGENADKGTDFVHFYVLTEEEFQKSKTELKPDLTFISRVGENKDSIMIPLSDLYAKANGLELRRRIANEIDENSIVQKIFNKNWNLDNFGPLKIPSNKVFVLGDNRDIAEDSRFVGLIDKSDIVGTVIIK
jgi:signal peptidase I